MAKKMLIAYADKEVLDASTAFFQKNGFEVLAASKGPEAADLLKQHGDISVIVLGSYLREVSVEDICRQIKGENRFSATLVFVMLPENEESQPYEALGIKEFMDDPFSNDRLLHRIDVALNYGKTLKAASEGPKKSNLVPMLAIGFGALLFFAWLFFAFVQPNLTGR